MARPAKGWSLRKPRPPLQPFYAVRFTNKAGRRVELSTGTSDPVEAARVGADLYARDLTTAVATSTRRINPLLQLDELFALWLADLEATHDEETVATYLGYTKRFVEHFGTLANVTRPRMGDYQRERLRRVLVRSVRKERSAMNTFLGWCVEQEILSEEQVPLWPMIAKKATGVRSGKQRAAPVDITAEQANAFIAALPIWSRPFKGRSYAVRDRFIVAYETALRPALLDELSVPEHWRPGASRLKIASEIDKARYGREVPLTRRAIDALTRVVTAHGITAGLVFGRHDMREHVERARKAAGLPEDFAPYDLRHGRIGHWLDETPDMRGVAFLAGHTLLTTTDKYLRGQQKSAVRVIDAVNSGDDPGSKVVAMLSAKEGSRTPTSVTPLEPESVDSDQQSNSSDDVGGHGGSRKDSQGQGFGDIPTSISSSARYLSALRAEWSVYDALFLDEGGQ